MSVRVFISYAHDSDTHRESVRTLWWRLREYGIDAKIDLTAQTHRQDWPQWMGDQLRQAERVLVVASPAYKKRADGHASADEGRGAQWEARLIREAFYANQRDGFHRFLPVVLPGGSADDVPDFLTPIGSTVYRVTDFSLDGMTTLLRTLTNQPADPEPPILSVPVLAPHPAPSWNEQHVKFSRHIAKDYDNEPEDQEEYDNLMSDLAGIQAMEDEDRQALDSLIEHGHDYAAADSLDGALQFYGAVIDAVIEDNDIPFGGMYSMSALQSASALIARVQGLDSALDWLKDYSRKGADSAQGVASSLLREHNRSLQADRLAERGWEGHA